MRACIDASLRPSIFLRFHSSTLHNPVRMFMDIMLCQRPTVKLDQLLQNATTCLRIFPACMCSLVRSGTAYVVPASVGARRRTDRPRARAVVRSGQCLTYRRTAASVGAPGGLPPSDCVLVTYVPLSPFRSVEFEFKKSSDLFRSTFLLSFVLDNDLSNFGAGRS